MAQQSSQRVRIVQLSAAFFLMLILLKACGGDRDQLTAEATKQTASSEPMPRAERFSSPAIENAKRSVAAEPAVVDYLYDPSNVIEWNIAVKDDGSKRYGYAQYICILLKEAGAYDEQVDVRIVDQSKRTEFKDAYRDYSLGAVRCADGTFLD